MKCIPKSPHIAGRVVVIGARGCCDLLCLAACRVSTHTLYIYIACRGDGVDAVFKDHPPKGRPGRTARGKSLRPQPLARVRAREKDPPRDAAATKAFSRMRRWCNQPSACIHTAPEYVTRAWRRRPLHTIDGSLK